VISSMLDATEDLCKMLSLLLLTGVYQNLILIHHTLTIHNSVSNMKTSSLPTLSSYLDAMMFKLTVKLSMKVLLII
jgi:hypothetical protein